MIKKAILLCLVFVFSNAFYAQEAKAKVKKAAAKTEKGIEKAANATEKGVKKAVDATGKGLKKAANATEKGVTKAAKATEKGVTKAANATDKAVTKTASRIKKDGTPDRRFKNAAEEADDMKVTAASKSAEKKVKDKVTGSYKGKKVFTGPRGGRYYINKNGNKTYLSDDQ